MDSPRMKTMFWSDSIRGAVRKRYAAVMWKSEIALTIVKPEMRPISTHTCWCVVLGLLNFMPTHRIVTVMV